MITAMSLTNGTLTVILNNGSEILTARNDHPKWNDILNAFKSQNESQLTQLLSMNSVVETYSNGNITVNGTGLLYKNRPMHGIDVDRVIAFLHDGLPYQPIANYIDRKMKNPSSRAVEEMYKFLEHRNMSLTPEGRFIAYKGVQDSFYSVHGNTETIVLQGVVNSNGQIFNEIGKVIEIERNCVSDDFRNPCGPGLHAGSLAYAKGWGQKVLLVEIDPSDVVSVPEDANCQKLRCCKYRVIGEYTGPLPDVYTSEFSLSDKSDKIEDGNEDDEDICPNCSGHDCACDHTNGDYCDYCGNPNFECECVHETKCQQECNNCNCNDSNEELKSKIHVETSELEDLVNNVIFKEESKVKNITLEDYPDYVDGMKSGIYDKVDGLSPKYIEGDKNGAETERHAKYIDGYIDGYNGTFNPTF